MSDFEKEMGFQFEESRWEQRMFRHGMHAMAGITVALSGYNYFAAPSDRLTYTGIPLAGAVALCGLAKAYDKIQDSRQDEILTYGMKDFPNAMDTE